MRPLARCSHLPRPGCASPALSFGARLRFVSSIPSRPQLSKRAIAAPSSNLQRYSFARQHRLMSTDDRLPDGEELAEDLKFFNQEKWGWVVYRTTYGDDDAWERFKVLVARYTRDYFQETETPPIVVDRVGWTFVSDPATLDGASREQLRERFVPWAAEAETAERLGPVPDHVARGDFKSSRYTYFVQVDEESLRSVVDADPSDMSNPGWVILVRCVKGQDYDVPPQVTRTREEEKREAEESGDKYDGEDWIMLAACELQPRFYSTLGSLSETWYTFYSQPPKLVVY